MSGHDDTFCQIDPCDTCLDEYESRQQERRQEARDRTEAYIEFITSVLNQMKKEWQQ